MPSAHPHRTADVEDELPLVGVAEIDRHHRVLRQRWRVLEDAQLRGNHRSVRANLWFLERYAGEHFDAEERLMTDSRYPGLAEHRREHERFRERISRLRLHVEAGRDASEAAHFAWIWSWFERHVREADAPFGQYLAGLAERLR
jgi:hemerythrin-like metal-binding protein